MFLAEPEQSPYDLRFTLFGTPVRVHYWFWIISVMLSWPILQVDPGPLGFFFLALSVGCIFVSILVHELGHIWMGRLFGTTGHIVLCSFYGLAVPHEPLHNRWQRIAVSFAGPGAGFVLLGIVFAGAFAVNQLLQDETPFWFRLVVAQLIWINLVWGLVNLLPVWPLDGGQISRELFEGYVRPNGLRISLIVSLVVAAVFAINSLSGLLRGPTIPYLPTGSLLSVLFFGFLALGSYQLLQMTPPAGGGGGRYRVEQESYERAPWERDADWWKRS